MLDISGGLSGGTVEWVQEGTKVATDPVAGSTYHATKPISLATLPTYVRTQARTSSTKAIVTMSEPIFFEGVTGLPKDMTFHVAGVTTTKGEHYEKNVDLKGITAEQWSANSLDLTLVNPAGSLVETVASTGGFTPPAVTVDGHAVSAASSLSAYDGATSSSWFFDSATRTLHVKATQGAATGTDLRVSFTGSTYTQPPITPGNLQPDGCDHHQHLARLERVQRQRRRVALRRQARRSTRCVAHRHQHHHHGSDVWDVSLHHRRRGGRGGEHVVTCEPDRGNPARPPTTTLTPVADAYVDASSASSISFGSSTKLRVDSSPDVRSYLRFYSTGISGVTSATLRVFQMSALTAGYDVHGVSDTSWANRR